MESLTTRPIGPRIPGWPIRPGTPCLREKEIYVCKYNKNIKCEKFFLLKITFYIRLEFMKYLCSVSFRDAPSQKESCNLRFVQIFPGHRVHPRPRVHPKMNKWHIESSTSEHYDDINRAKTKKLTTFPFVPLTPDFPIGPCNATSKTRELCGEIDFENFAYGQCLKNAQLPSFEINSNTYEQEWCFYRSWYYRGHKPHGFCGSFIKCRWPAIFRRL